MGLRTYKPEYNVKNFSKCMTKDFYSPHKLLRYQNTFPFIILRENLFLKCFCYQLVSRMLSIDKKMDWGGEGGEGREGGEGGDKGARSFVCLNSFLLLRCRVSSRRPVN